MRGLGDKPITTGGVGKDVFVEVVEGKIKTAVVLDFDSDLVFFGRKGVLGRPGLFGRVLCRPVLIVHD